MEADAFPCSYVGLPYNPYGCRTSDAALAKYSKEPALDTMQVNFLGRVARPDGRNNGSINLDTTSPLFQIISTGAGVIEGDTLEKVGQTTGWTGGVVVEPCLDYERDSGPSLLCTIKVQAQAGGGDSGSAVFSVLGETLSSTQVELHGTLWGGYGCNPFVTPVMCQGFYANNLELIEIEINASLSYW